MRAVFIRLWLKAHPEVVAQIEVSDDETVLLQLWNPDKTKILFKLQLNPSQQNSLVARLEGFFR